MSKVIIIGAGAMGSAFAFPCLDRNHDTTVIGTHLEDKFIEELKSDNNFHSALKVNIPKSINISKFEKIFKIKSSKVKKVSNMISKKILSLPFGPYITKQEQDKVLNIFKRYQKQL